MFLKIRILIISSLFIFLFSVSFVHAFDVNNNHTGSYIYAMGGIQRVSQDTNARTGLTFGNGIEAGMGLTYGYNITDWIAPELQFSYVTATGTTPSGSAREHVLTVRLNAKYSFLTGAGFNQDRTVKIYPYVKAGGLVHGLYVNAPNANDKIGAWGGGFGVGGGLEVNIKALYLGLDVSNDFVFLRDQFKTIAGTRTQILNGGFSYQYAVMGAVGVHF